MIRRRLWSCWEWCTWPFSSERGTCKKQPLRGSTAGWKHTHAALGCFGVSHTGATGESPLIVDTAAHRPQSWHRAVLLLPSLPAICSEKLTKFLFCIRDPSRYQAYTSEKSREKSLPLENRHSPGRYLTTPLKIRNLALFFVFLKRILPPTIVLWLEMLIMISVKRFY